MPDGMSNHINRHEFDDGALTIDHKVVAELVNRVKAGKITAFDDLVRLFQKPIFNLAFRMINNYEAAQDITQEVFMKAFRSLGQFKGASLFSTWLYAIAVNTCRNQRQAAQRKSFFEVRGRECGENGQGGKDLMVDPAPGPDTHVERNETRQAIQNVIAGLSEEFATAIILRDIQDMSYEQIAEVLGCSLGTVKSRISRARWLVREQLEAHYPDLKP